MDGIAFTVVGARFIGVNQDIQSKLVEPDDVEQHSPHLRGKEVLCLAEYRAYVLPGPFKGAIVS